jgi:hypothetical protein
MSLSECEIKTRVNPALALPNVTLLSRSQWRKTRKRKVIVGDEQAQRVIVTRTGYCLHLFDESPLNRKTKNRIAGKLNVGSRARH